MEDFNVDEIYYKMLAVVTPFYKGLWPAIKPVAEASLGADLVLLQSIAGALANGWITKEFALTQAKKIPDLLATQLLAFAVIGESMAQQAANAVLDLLTGIIGSLVPKTPATA